MTFTQPGQPTIAILAIRQKTLETFLYSAERELRARWLVMKVRAWLALLPMVLWSAAQAATLDVELVDHKGQPLPEAVLWVEPGPANAPAANAVMDQQKRTFVPYILPVQVGTTVVFPNSDPINHHVYSFSPTKRFELRLHHQGDQAQEVLFDKPGLVTLGCNIHDWMLGFVLVLESPWFAQTDARGRARLEFEAADGQHLRVWHPRIADPPDSLSRMLDGAASLRIQLAQPLKRDPRGKPPLNIPRGKGGYVR
jgi:plastocyanin